MTEKFYSRHNFHTDLRKDISLLKEDEKNSVRESIGYCFVVPVDSYVNAVRAGENIGQYNDFEPRDILDVFNISEGLIYVGYEYSPVIYAPLEYLNPGFIPCSDEIQIIVGNDGHKYLRLWWD